MAPGSVSLAKIPRDLQLPALATAALLCLLYWQPGSTLPRDWWQDADASHGLLLAPVAIILAWKRGIAANAHPQRVAGTLLLGAAITLRIGGGLAAELFMMRLSLLLAVIALVVFVYGFVQVRHWWLSVALLVFAIPIPAAILSSVALPLQLQASKMGAALLELRYVPVAVSGNVIQVPGKTLFVTEACSGLRSLTALVSLSLLFGGIFLNAWPMRAILLAAALPIAVLLNSIRIFLTGFLVYYVSPEAGDGFLHYTEGWLLFLLALLILGFFGWLLAHIERRRSRA